ncbi:MAG: Hpt domain-containing protein [Bacteriovoracaceae bacterium]|nr:Hpt domain-containing protein [Bacteriovoracaceae bacterium]
MSDKKFIIEIDSDIKELIPDYLENRAKEIVQLSKATSTQDFALLETIGHKLAGNAGGYGFDDLGVLGLALENAAIAHNMALIEIEVLKIKHYVENVEVKFI